MLKNYTTPSVKILTVQAQDVITSSPTINVGEQVNGGWSNAEWENFGFGQ